MKKKRKVTSVLITLAIIYVLLCLGVFVMQDALLFPGANFGSDATPKVKNVRVETNQTADGTSYRLAIAKSIGKPKAVVLFFLGNGETLQSGVSRAAGFAGYGFESIASEYPGYGGSAGSPSYESFLAAADASGKWASALAKKLGVPLYLVGQSIGSFSAVHLAANGLGERLLLISPPTTIAAAGQSRFWFLPVGLLLRHLFDNMERAADVKIPTLVIHGDRDTIVPVEMGKAVAAAIPGAEFELAKGYGHNSMDPSFVGPFRERIRAHFQ